jgi:hypothetical protein
MLIRILSTDTGSQENMETLGMPNGIYKHDCIGPSLSTTNAPECVRSGKRYQLINGIIHTSYSMNAVAEATAGAVAEIVATAAVFPLDVVKVRLQTDKAVQTRRLSSLALVLRLFAEEGIIKIYEKFPAKAIAIGVSRFTFYFLYSALQTRYKALFKLTKIGIFPKLLLGYLSGIINTAFNIPCEKIAVRVMSSKKQLSVMDAVSQVSGKGLLSFYDGGFATFYTSMNPALSNTIFDRFKKVLLKERANLGYFESFFLGAFGKACATTITYPAIRSKSILQRGAGFEKMERMPSVFEVTTTNFRIGGLAGVYHGIGATLSKSVIQSAFMLMVREQIEGVVKDILVGKMRI